MEWEGSGAPWRSKRAPTGAASPLKRAALPPIASTPAATAKPPWREPRGLWLAVVLIPRGSLTFAGSDPVDLAPFANLKQAQCMAANWVDRLNRDPHRLTVLQSHALLEVEKVGAA